MGISLSDSNSSNKSGSVSILVVLYMLDTEIASYLLLTVLLIVRDGGTLFRPMFHILLARTSLALPPKPQHQTKMLVMAHIEHRNGGSHDVVWANRHRALVFYANIFSLLNHDKHASMAKYEQRSTEYK